MWISANTKITLFKLEGHSYCVLKKPIFVAFSQSAISYYKLIEQYQVAEIVFKLKPVALLSALIKIPETHFQS
jgi:hypothetical protein